MRVEDDAVGLRAAEHIHIEARFGSAYLNGLELRISLGLHFDFHRHMEKIEVLFQFADDLETLFGPVNGVIERKFRYARRIEPLGEKRP